jgi:hypothetical protein
MHSIKFKAAYGHEDKYVRLTNHFGGGDGYYLYVGSGYCGMIMFQQGHWAIHLNPKSDEEFTTEDRTILIDIVKESQPPG